MPHPIAPSYCPILLPQPRANPNPTPNAQVHECSRAFSDRFNTAADKDFFVALLDEKLVKDFQGVEVKKLFKGGEITCFGDFMREVPEGKRAPYEEIADRAALKRFCEEKLEDLNMEPGAAQMDLVMFGDALSHVCRIKRIISMPRANALLVGVGGSGRQSLTRLSCYIAEYKVPLLPPTLTLTLLLTLSPPLIHP